MYDPHMHTHIKHSKSQSLTLLPIFLKLLNHHVAIALSVFLLRT